MLLHLSWWFIKSKCFERWFRNDSEDNMLEVEGFLLWVPNGITCEWERQFQIRIRISTIVWYPIHVLVLKMHLFVGKRDKILWHSIQIHLECMLLSNAFWIIKKELQFQWCICHYEEVLLITSKSIIDLSWLDGRKTELIHCSIKAGVE